jgi:uncharacterized small protein (DUF1192 family)
MTNAGDILGCAIKFNDSHNLLYYARDEGDKMMFEDLEPSKKFTGKEIGQNLERFSVAELEHYITALEDEISRVRQDIERKKASQSAADAFFKK